MKVRVLKEMPFVIKGGVYTLRDIGEVNTCNII